jgi:hypothetical protein
VIEDLKQKNIKKIMKRTGQNHMVQLVV